MIPPVRWKQIRGFPLYEISEEGQVRLANGYLGGVVKARYRRINVGHGKAATVKYRDNLNQKGTVFVVLTTGEIWRHGIHNKYCATHSDGGQTKEGQPRLQVSVADLMDQHWPGVKYPSDWRAKRKLVHGANQFGPYKLKSVLSPLEGHESDEDS